MIRSGHHLIVLAADEEHGHGESGQRLLRRSGVGGTLQRAQALHRFREARLEQQVGNDHDFLMLVHPPRHRLLPDEVGKRLRCRLRHVAADVPVHLARPVVVLRDRVERHHQAQLAGQQIEQLAPIVVRAHRGGWRAPQRANVGRRQRSYSGHSPRSRGPERPRRALVRSIATVICAQTSFRSSGGAPGNTCSSPAGESPQSRRNSPPSTPR